MTAKKLFSLAVIALSGIVLLWDGHAVNDGTLPRAATVPTTQSTVDMDSEEESDEALSGLLAPTLDMSNPADRQKLLENFDREREILKRKGLSEGDLDGLKDAIMNGDVEEIKRFYRKKARNDGGK